jgi:MFS family permease
LNTRRWYDAISINIFWLGLTSVSQTINPLIIPLFIQQFVGESQQGTYLGIIRFWSLMAAIVFQSIFGTLSDQFKSRFGKRKPFIVIGTIGLNFIIFSIGFVQNISGELGYWVLFSMILILMFFANMAHGALQGLIPDLVPKSLYGRYAGIKALFEIPIPAILISITIADLIGNGNLWGAIIVLLIVLDISAVITMAAPEQATLQNFKITIPWKNITPLLLMTVAFGTVILLTREILPLIEFFIHTSDLLTQTMIMTITGISLISIAILLGVNISVRIGLGKNGSLIHHNYRVWLINRLAFLLGVTNMVSFLIYFLQEKMHITGTEAVLPASIVMRYVGVFILVSALPGGWLADRFSKIGLIRLSTCLAFSGALVLLLSQSLNQIYFGGVLLGSAAGLFYSTNWALGTELVPINESGKFLGISNVSSAGAGAIGAYLGGPIADYFSIAQPGFPGYGYFVLFIIFSGTILLSIMALPFIKENDK